jgi:release factor glutamine methyltransferase
VSELASASRGDPLLLHALVSRRLRGEPLAWITGRAPFDGLDVRVESGVYVPRWQSVALSRRAADRLPQRGTAIDVCTGSGALAMALRRARPEARVLATDTDPRAVACARSNGVEASLGDLFSPVPGGFMGATDLIVAIPPYVPTTALSLLPHDTLTFEDASHYDGGPAGTDVLNRVVAEARPLLRPGGALLLELGGDQAGPLGELMESLGYTSIVTWADEDGDIRGVEGTVP